MLLHVVDDAAFDVGDAFRDERGLDRFGLRRSQPELPEFIGVGPRAGSNPHHGFCHVDGRDGDDAFLCLHERVEGVVPCARHERQFRGEVHHQSP